MARRYDELAKEHIAFIKQQKLFFIGTAANDGTINVSPKGWTACECFHLIVSRG